MNVLRRLLVKQPKFLSQKLQLVTDLEATLASICNKKIELCANKKEKLQLHHHINENIQH